MEFLPDSGHAVPSESAHPARAVEVEEQLAPGLRALAHATDEADELRLAFGCGTDDDQQALRGVLESRLHVDAVGPKVDIALCRKFALAPARMLFRPGPLESSNGRGRQPASVLAKQRD